MQSKLFIASSICAISFFLANCSPSSPQLQHNEGPGAVAGSGTNGLGNTGIRPPVFNGTNQAPTLRPLSTYSVSAGDAFSVSLQATDPENLPLRYVVACPPELGGTQNNNTGQFTLRANADLRTQDAQCGAMAVDSGAMQAKQIFVVRVTGQYSYATASATQSNPMGALAAIAVPVAMNVLGLNSGSSTWYGDRSSSGAMRSDWASSVDWSSATQNAWSNASDPTFLSNLDAFSKVDLSAAYSQPNLFDTTKSGSSDWLKAWDSSAYAPSTSVDTSGLDFSKLWGSDSVKFETSGYVFEPSTDTSNVNWWN